MREVALFRERGALIDTEAVLLVRDDEREGRELHAVTDECVRADGKLNLAGFESLNGFAFCFGAHAARDEHRFDAAGGEEIGEGLVVLRRQNFRRSHERRLKSVLNDRVAQRRRHGCFTAADIALNEAVHRVRALHVADAVLHGTLLCAGHREGEQGGKLFCIILFERIRIFAHTCAADFRHAELQDEQFLEHESSARRGKRFGRIRKVDRFERVFEAAQRVFQAKRIGQRVFDGLGEQAQGFFYRVCDDARGEAARLRVNRHHVLHAAFGNELRGGHFAAHERARHLAAKRVDRALREQTCNVAVIEKGQLHVVFAVRDGRLVKRHAAADTLLDRTAQHCAFYDIHFV